MRQLENLLGKEQFKGIVNYFFEIRRPWQAHVYPYFVPPVTISHLHLRGDTYSRT